ncbi:acyl-CoA dehydrogenase family protein [Humidisolicoccus flavus]|uniref:acyl-CoA dehydrogenase family protein n=1 Tax=Humidisolicoccus flavus TaxID=3111414 RepID=UPI00324314A3
MTFTPLSSDFYGFSEDLQDDEKTHLLSLRRYLESEVAPIVDDHWEHATFPMDVIQGLVKHHAIGLGFPETAPFPNSSVFRGWVALEMSRVDASVSTFVGVQNGLAMGSIALCGSPEQRAEWLPQLASCAQIGAFGLTEPLSGSDSAQGLRTTARREGDEWVLNGAKRWIGNATFADVVVIWAKDVEDNQVKGFIVPTSSEGFTTSKIEHKMSLRIVQNADITLENVRVDERLRLQNANSFRDTAKVLRQTRAEVAWSAVGVMAGAYEAALQYSQERVQFGKPIAGHQLVQSLLAKSLGNITASIALVSQVSTMQDRGTQRDDHSALAKAFTTEKMRETVAWCREICGGNGIVTDSKVGRFFADAEALYSYEGTYQMNSLIVGKSVSGVGAFV